jgi:hypothetical protein
VLVLSVVAGVGLILTEEEFIFFALLVWVAGPLGAWVSSWFLYGFGEIICTLQAIEENTRGSALSLKKQEKTAKQEPSKKSTPAKQTAKTPPSKAKTALPEEEEEEEEDDEGVEEGTPQTRCPKCGKEHDFDYPKCPHCGHKYEQ